MERYLFTERCSLSRALQPSLKIPSERTPPRFPNGPLQRHPSPELPSKSLVNEPPPVPQQGPYGERCFVSKVNGLFIHLYLSESPIKEHSHKNKENIWSLSMETHQMEGLHTVGCGLVPQGNRLWHCYRYPSAMQPSAQYLPPWLG